MRNLIPNFIAEKYSQNITTGSFNAITMFLDISGFTSMTEQLMREGKEGAEVLSVIINNIFEPVIEVVYSTGGFISTFAGDAFTAIFPDIEKPIQVIFCAVEINKKFKEIGRQLTKYGEFELFVKLGLSFGVVEWGITGTENHKTFFFKGKAIDGCAHSEHNCEKKDIVFDYKLFNLLSSEQIGVVKIDDKHYKLINCKQTAVRNAQNNIETSFDVLQKFIPIKILEINHQDEFRQIVSVFISFKELDNYEQINEVIANIISQCDLFGGYFEVLDFGDKGATCLVVFGVPKSYENDLERALNFALEVKKLLQENVRIGISSGIAYVGFKGSSIRMGYGVFGAVVNLSARLMIKAKFGDLLTTEKISKNNGFTFSFQGCFSLKGIDKKTSSYSLIGKKENTESAFFSGEMIGRQNELNQLVENAKPLSEHKFANISIVYGEAGMGKSRLVYEFVKSQQSAEPIFMQTDSILKLSFNPFKYFLNNYFIKTNECIKEDKKAGFEIIFNQLLDNLKDSNDGRKLAIIKELERIKSVLAAQVDISFVDSLYEQLDAKGRFDNIIFAYKELFKAMSVLKPIIIQIEDIQWLDEDSHKVIQNLCRLIADFPIMIVATSRFNDDGSKPCLKIDTETFQQEIILEKLEQENAEHFIKLHLENPPDKNLLKFINDKAEFNPFYIEQIINYLMENNLLESIDEKITLTKQSIEIPDNINAIIVARIDRLATDLKNIVQLASILGREVELKVFFLMLELYTSILNKKEIEANIERIEDEQIWKKLNEIKYIFKHALLHEAVYEMQLKTRLRELHNLAALSMEQIYGDNAEKFYEIAYHFDKALKNDSAMKYYEKAGDWFQKNYDNIKALECFNRLLEFLDKKEDLEIKIIILNKKSHSLNLLGKKDEEMQVELLVESLASKIGNEKDLSKAKCNIAGLYRLLGENDKAMTYFQQSYEISAKNNLDFIVGEVLGGLGKIHFKQGKLDNAMDYFNKQLTIATKLNDADLSSLAVVNISNIYKLRGDVEKTEQYLELDLKYSIDSGDPISTARSLGNLGVFYWEMKNDCDKALDFYNKSLKKFEDCHDYANVAICSQNMGLVYQQLGDYSSAMDCYQKCLKASEELNYLEAMMVTLINIGNIHTNTGTFNSALECYNKANQVALKLNDKLQISMIFINQACVYTELKEFLKAEELCDKAITMIRELEAVNYLTVYLKILADLFYVEEKYKDAQTVNMELNQLALTQKNQSMILDSQLLTCKIDFNMTSNDFEKDIILTKMFALLDEVMVNNEEEKTALIFYEIWKMNHSKDQQTKALELYQTLYTKTPNYDYKNKIDELKKL